MRRPISSVGLFLGTAGPRPNTSVPMVFGVAFMRNKASFSQQASSEYVVLLNRQM
jgi:hypothetical protein